MNEKKTCKIILMEDLERIVDRMHCCTAMLSVLIDSESAGTNSTSVHALCGVNDLLKLSCDLLEAVMEDAAVYTERGAQQDRI